MERDFLSNSVFCILCFCYLLLKIHPLLFWEMVLKKNDPFFYKLPYWSIINYHALHRNSEIKQIPSLLQEKKIQSTPKGHYLHNIPNAGVQFKIMEKKAWLQKLWLFCGWTTLSCGIIAARHNLLPYQFVLEKGSWPDLKNTPSRQAGRRLCANSTWCCQNKVPDCCRVFCQKNKGMTRLGAKGREQRKNDSLAPELGRDQVSPG